MRAEEQYITKIAVRICVLSDLIIPQKKERRCVGKHNRKEESAKQKRSSEWCAGDHPHGLLGSYDE